MKLSKASSYTLKRIHANGGSLPCEGNLTSGRALQRRKFVSQKKGRFVITAKGRKWLDKN